MNKPDTATTDKAARQAAAYAALLREILAYEAKAFDNAEPINGADLVDWFEEVRGNVRDTLAEDEPVLCVVASGSPFDGMALTGPFIDFDVASSWAERECAGEQYEVVSIDPDPAIKAKAPPALDPAQR